MYYHLRSHPNLQVSEPHIPYMVTWGEPEVARVCACPTVQGCILSLDGVDDMMMKFVYVIEDEPDVCNTEIVRRYYTGSLEGEVFDAGVTGEVWYTHSVRVTLVGQLGELVDNLWVIL